MAVEYNPHDEARNALEQAIAYLGMVQENELEESAQSILDAFNELHPEKLED